MKNLEIRTIEHKGIKVTIRINYDDGTADLVERVDGSWRVKQWQFRARGLEYMQGWMDVIQAMSVAVKECEKELENDLAEKTKFKEDLVIKVIKEVKKK